MKLRMSISVDEKTVKQIQDKLRSGLFRNKSHVVEYAVRKLVDGAKDD